MKKNLFLCFSMAAFVASAQPVIQTTNFMPIGLTFTLSAGGPVSPGSGGANQTWDFSAAPVSPAGTLAVIDPTTTPCIGMFSGSNWGEMVPATNPYLYFLRTSSQIEVMGENWSASCTGGISYSNTKIALKFPFNYLDTYSDPYVNTNGSFTCTPTYDGYGTLITPTGTLTNVARVSYSDGGNNYTEWFTTGNPSYPVMLAQSSSTIFFSNPTMAVKETVSHSVNVYPNPAKEMFTVEAIDGESRQLSLYDMCGKLVMTKAFSGSAQISTGELNEGVYYVNIKDQNGIYNQKVVVVK